MDAKKGHIAEKYRKEKKMIICITGTPGTGKTYFAKLLEKKAGFRYLDLNRMIKEERLYEDYDRKAKTYDVDTKKLSRFLDMLLRKYRYNKEDKDQKIQYMILKRCIGKESSIISISGLFKKKKINKMNNIIIDSHLSHYLTSDFCIVVRSDIKTLHERLGKRRYGKKKIEDNIESEIFGICLEEAKALNHDIIIVNN